MLLLCCAESLKVVLLLQFSMFRSYWVSQSLQQPKNCDLGDSSRKTRLQRWRQLCKLITKKRRDLQVKARTGVRNNTISTNFTGVSLLLLYRAPALLYRKRTSGVVTAVVHVSLLPGFTAAAAAEELRTRRQQHANSSAAAVTQLCKLGAK